MIMSSIIMAAILCIDREIKTWQQQFAEVNSEDRGTEGHHP